jgi:hypothetical protein
MPASALRAAVLGAVVLALAACGQTTTETVTRTVTKEVATTTSATAPKAKEHRAAASSSPARRRPTATTWTSCDPNVAVVRPHTSCGFAQNAFYEYWVSGYATTLRVYSPALGASLTTRCTKGTATATCRTGDGGRVRFALAALAAYSSDQATAYAPTHDVGPGATAGPGASEAAPEADDGGGEDGSPPMDERIPNFDEGTGSVVRCGDGMYSQSGGRPGACSGHGGVAGR